MSVPVEDTVTCSGCQDTISCCQSYTCDGCEEPVCNDCLKFNNDIEGVQCSQCYDDYVEVKREKRGSWSNE